MCLLRYLPQIVLSRPDFCVKLTIMLLHISHWAKGHRYAARFVIVLTRMIFLVAPVTLGLLVWQPQMASPVWLEYGGAFLFFLGIAFFPKGTLRTNYYQRVRCHALMTLGYISVLFSFGLDLARIYEPINRDDDRFEARTVALRPNAPVENHPSLTSALLTKPVKWLYQKTASYKKAATTSSKVGAIILGSILLIIGLVIFSGASCALSCGIYDSSTVFMLLMSIASIVGGIMMIIFGMTKSKPDKKPNPIVPDDNTIHM
jgi:ABC-type multidrug transport system fused ATPase/permease subunit